MGQGEDMLVWILLDLLLIVFLRDNFLVKWGMIARYWPAFVRTLKDTKFQPLYVRT